MEESNERFEADTEQLDDVEMETTQESKKKQRNTDHKVYHREPAALEGADEGEFEEKKKRGKRVKRKRSEDTERDTTAGAQTSMDVDDGETVAKKPHFKRLTGGKEKVK